MPSLPSGFLWPRRSGAEAAVEADEEDPLLVNDGGSEADEEAGVGGYGSGEVQGQRVNRKARKSRDTGDSAGSEGPIWS